MRVARIILAAADKHNVKVDDILGYSRRRAIVHARHEAMAMVRAITKLSYPAIGRIFRRDHTTVIDGIRRHHEGHPRMKLEHYHGPSTQAQAPRQEIHVYAASAPP